LLQISKLSQDIQPPEPAVEKSEAAGWRGNLADFLNQHWLKSFKRWETAQKKEKNAAV
jgi:hypothetical protein